MPNNHYNSAPSPAKYQGTQNAGKVLQVNQNGIVEPVEMGSGLPDVTSADNGKFLTVVNGAWAATAMQVWQGGSY